MNLMHNSMERLRPIVGLKSWDYFVVWRLSEDQRSLEWMDCCCAGTENINNGEELFHVSSALPCRDVIFQHPRTKACDLLALLPSSIPLDSGSNIHAETLMSNQVRWLNFSPNSDSTVSEESIGTRVLVPIPFGLLEMFVANQIPEDQQIIELITAQCNISLEQQGIMIQPDNITSSFSVNVNGYLDAPLKHLAMDQSDEKDSHGILYPKQNQELPCDIMLYDGTHELNAFIPSTESGNHDMNALQKQMISHSGNVLMQTMEPSSNKEEQGIENDSYKQENGQSNSLSDSDPNDDDDDAKYRRRNGKGPQSKNLMAERKRRKKLNDRLYALRALVPNISKLDRASILGDAIEYVKELKQQVNDLQNELEENSDDENPRNSATSSHNVILPNVFQKNGMHYGTTSEHENNLNGDHKGTLGNDGIDMLNQNQEAENGIDKVQQMEPQVEVTQLDGNEFFVKVFCEHKPGGFARLMEALNSLGLEVTNVNATRHTCLVSYIFKVERKDSEMLQADHVRESLLELTRNPSRGWPEIAKASENGDKLDFHQLHHHHHLRSSFHSHQLNSHHLHHLYD